MEKLHYTSPAIPGLIALSCTNDFVFEKHIHSGHVLWLNSEGGEQYSIKGNSSILQPGSVSVIEPGVVHSNRPSTGAKRHLRSLYLEEDFFNHLTQLFSGAATPNYILPTKLFTDKKNWNNALFLHEAIITDQEKMLLEESVLNLFTHLQETPSSSEQFGLNSEDRRVEHITQYMKAHLANEVSLDTLATLVQCTPFHLIRLFKKNLGMSPHSYFVQLRLERARDLLDNGLAIADAALLAGFSDQSHLTRKFKKRYGITPGMYNSQKNSSFFS